MCHWSLARDLLPQNPLACTCTSQHCTQVSRTVAQVARHISQGPQGSNEEIRLKRSRMFEAEQKRQAKLIPRLEKIEVQYMGGVLVL